MHDTSAQPLRLVLLLALAVIVGGFSLALCAERAPGSVGAGELEASMRPLESLLPLDAHPAELVPLEAPADAPRELASLGRDNARADARTILAAYGLGLAPNGEDAPRAWLALVLGCTLLAAAAVVASPRGRRRRSASAGAAVLVAALAALLLAWCTGGLDDALHRARDGATVEARAGNGGVRGILPAVGAAGPAASAAAGAGRSPGAPGATIVAGNGPRATSGALVGAAGAGAPRFGPISAVRSFAAAPAGPVGLAVDADGKHPLALLLVANDGSGSDDPPIDRPKPPEHPVPEPGGALLLAVGLALAQRRVRRRHPERVQDS